MFEREVFLKQNPHIYKMLQNDIDLKNICNLQYLRTLTLKSVPIPILYNLSEIQYSLNDFGIQNYVKYFLWLVVNNKLVGNLKYYNCQCSEKDVKELVEIIKKAFEIARSKYIEYFSGLLGIEVKTQCKLYGSTVREIEIVIKLVEHYSNALVDNLTFLCLCVIVKEQLIKNNKISKRMTEYEIAKVLYNWVVLHINYDTTFQKYSYTGYSGLVYGYAVCQGYTAVYNALCKLFGINIVGMVGRAKGRNDNHLENHIWSFALLNNKNTYIDVTWGSPLFLESEKLVRFGINIEDLCDFEFFDIPFEKLKQDHKWDRSLYG